MNRYAPWLLPALGLVFACSEDGAARKTEQDPDAAADVCAKEATHGHMILDYSAGISQTGAQGVTVTIADAMPAPPVRGEDNWSLKIDQSGSPLAGAKLTLYPLMVDHGHSSLSTPVVKDNGDGTYAVSMNLYMAGFWDAKITVTSGDVTDVVHFGFCVE